LILMGSSGPVLAGDGLRVDSGVFLNGFRVTGHGEVGAVRLCGARITGQLPLRGAQLTDEAGIALAGDGLQVEGSLFLDEGFHATGCGENGAVRLVWAHITGGFSLAGAQLTNQAGPALVGDGLRVGGDLLSTRGFGQPAVVSVVWCGWSALTSLGS
jgi:hypothetical protein